jgi:hypothetical protein
LAHLALSTDRVAVELRALADRAGEAGLQPPGYTWGDVRGLADALHTVALRYAVNANDAPLFFHLLGRPWPEPDHPRTIRAEGRPADNADPREDAATV